MWTDQEIKALKPRKTTYQLSENTRERGRGRLVVQVEPTGSKQFYYQYFLKGERTLIKIGKYKQSAGDDGFSLSEAREKKGALADIFLHHGDVKGFLEEQKRKLAEEKRAKEAQGCLEDLLTAYITDMKARGKRTFDRVEKEVELYVFTPFPSLRLKPSNEVTIEEIKAVLRRMTRKGIKTQTNRVRGHLHAMFQYGLRHDHDYEVDADGLHFNLQFNPVAATQRKKHFEQVGEHVISDDDIHKFWRLSKTELGPIAAATIKLAFATGGQRTNELLRTPWDGYDLDKKLLTIPGQVSKNGLLHLVPLTDMAICIMEELKRLTGNVEYPLAGVSEGVYADKPMRSDSLSKAIQRFCDAHTGHDDTEKNITKFIPRDVRRTCKTLMGAAGISKEIRDRLQNHAMRSDVSSKHYDRYDYLSEKQAGLKIWNDYLELIIHPKDNVVRLKIKK